jgi:hypothetical protein
MSLGSRTCIILTYNSGNSSNRSSGAHGRRRGQNKYTQTHTHTAHSVYMSGSLYDASSLAPIFSFFWKCVVVGFISIYKTLSVPDKTFPSIADFQPRSKKETNRISLFHSILFRDIFMNILFSSLVCISSASSAYMVCSFLGHQIISRFCISMLLPCYYYTSWMNWKCFDVVDVPPSPLIPPARFSFMFCKVFIS